MADRKWLGAYSGQTTRQLIALASDHRTDSVVLAFEQALQQKAARLGAGALTEEEHAVLAVEALEREVNNGDYLQFFDNSREFAPSIVGALQRIACPAAAKLTQEVLLALGLREPVTVDDVAQALERAAEIDLDELDRRYFKVVGDLAGPLLEFIRVNQHRITLP